LPGAERRSYRRKVNCPAQSAGATGEDGILPGINTFCGGANSNCYFRLHTKADTQFHRAAGAGEAGFLIVILIEDVGGFQDQVDAVAYALID